MTDEHKLLALITQETSFVAGLETPLDSLNLDSLDFVDLMLRCDNEFGVKIPDSAFPNLNTVGDILKAITEARVQVPS
jgi:acyl carrier protein